MKFTTILSIAAAAGSAFAASQGNEVLLK